jgi:hypothetical protein
MGPSSAVANGNTILGEVCRFLAEVKGSCVGAARGFTGWVALRLVRAIHGQFSRVRLQLRLEPY